MKSKYDLDMNEDLRSNLMNIPTGIGSIMSPNRSEQTQDYYK